MGLPAEALAKAGEKGGGFGGPFFIYDGFTFAHSQAIKRSNIVAILWAEKKGGISDQEKGAECGRSYCCGGCDLSGFATSEIHCYGVPDIRLC